MAMWLGGYVAMWMSSKCFEHFDSQISKDNIFPGCSQIFLDFFEVFWYDKMKKYGAPGVGKSRNHENQDFDV